ncbi:MAG: transporter [Acidobacteria bacterium]|nr:transporter [Acidobacteriota bacterium]
MKDDKALRDLLRSLLDWDNAHIRFDDAVKDFPRELRGIRPDGGPHSPWELLEHLRIALADILEFSRDAAHVSPEFPSGYWPSTSAPPTETAWDESAEAYRASLREFGELAADSSIDLFATIPHGTGQTVLREILLAADHNAYHVGQLMMVRRILGA